jgi:hypothetical protein
MNLALDTNWNVHIANIWSEIFADMNLSRKGTVIEFAPEGKYAYLVTLISGYDNELGSAVDPVLLTNYIANK